MLMRTQVFRDVRLCVSSVSQDGRRGLLGPLCHCGRKHHIPSMCEETTAQQNSVTSQSTLINLYRIRTVKTHLTKMLFTITGPLSVPHSCKIPFSTAFSSKTICNLLTKFQVMDMNMDLFKYIYIYTHTHTHARTHTHRHTQGYSK